MILGTSFLFIYLYFFTNWQVKPKYVFNDIPNNFEVKNKSVSSTKIKLQMLDKKEQLIDVKKQIVYEQEILERYDKAEQNIFNLDNFINYDFYTVEEAIDKFFELIFVNKIYTFKASRVEKELQRQGRINPIFFKYNKTYQEYVKSSFLLQAFKYKLYKFNIDRICSEEKEICLKTSDYSLFCDVYNRYKNDKKNHYQTKEYIKYLNKWAIK